jgi:hypothetical protein
MVWKKIATLSFIWLLLLTVSNAQEPPKAAPTNFVNDIRQVDFKNFTYKRQGREKESEVLELRDGKYVSASGAECWLMRIAYGDLTGDAIEEAVVLLRGQNTRISRTLDEVLIYTLKSGGVHQLTRFEAGRRGEYILSVGSLGSNFKIENGVLTLDQAILREGEDVPTHYYTIKYRWNGIQMVELERSALKPIPENMMEVG